MRTIEISNELIELREPNPQYQELVAEEELVMQGVFRFGGVIDMHQTIHVNAWETDDFFDWKKDDRQAVRDRWLGRLTGNIVVDLGSGNMIKSSEPFQRFLVPYAPKAYVGVDHRVGYGYRAYQEVPDFGIVMPIGKEPDDILPGAMIRGDMLDVLSQLPDDSMDFAINGIDEDMVQTSKPYGEAVLAEVKRVARPGGIIFGVTFAGGLLTELQKDLAFEAERITPFPGPRPQGYYFLSKQAA